MHAIHCQKYHSSRPQSGMLTTPSLRIVAVRPSACRRRTSATTISQLPISPEPSVQQLAQKNPAYRAALAVQGAVLRRAAEQLPLHPVHYPGAENGTLIIVSKDKVEKAEDPSMGGVVRAVHGGRVRWLSTGALASAASDFGTTRSVGFVNSSTDVPHYFAEIIVYGSGPDARAQGIITLGQRSDIVLDSAYYDRYYNRAPAGHAATQHPLRTWNDLYNGCAARQVGAWRHYQVQQADTKPLIANSIAYTFPAVEEEVVAFGEAALASMDLWAGFLLELDLEEAELVSPGLAIDRREIMAGYDARHMHAVRTDPGNKIAAKILGEGVTRQLVDMTCGPEEPATPR